MLVGLLSLGLAGSLVSSALALGWGAPWWLAAIIFGSAGSITVAVFAIMQLRISMRSIMGESGTQLPRLGVKDRASHGTSTLAPGPLIADPRDLA